MFRAGKVLRTERYKFFCTHPEDQRVYSGIDPIIEACCKCGKSRTGDGVWVVLGDLDGDIPQPDVGLG